MNLDAGLQNIENVGKKFAIYNHPSDVVSRIHVYVHLRKGILDNLKTLYKASPIKSDKLGPKFITKGK